MHTLFDTLKNDHQKIKDLLKLLESSGSNSPSTRDNLMEELKEKLVPHARAEEESLYLAMKNSNDKQAEMLGFEGDFEHQLVDQLIKELDICITTSPTWEAKLSILKNNLDHHIQEEEKVVFSVAEAAFSAPKLDLILDEFRNLKEKSKQHFNDYSKKKPTDEAVQISFS